MSWITPRWATAEPRRWPPNDEPERVFQHRASHLCSVRIPCPMINDCTQSALLGRHKWPRSTLTRRCSAPRTANSLIELSRPTGDPRVDHSYAAVDEIGGIPGCN